MAYITTTEANDFMGTSGEDTLVASLIGYAEALLNTKLNVSSLTSAPHDEEHEYNGAGPYYLKEKSPTVLTTVDNVVIEGEYKFCGRRLMLERDPGLKDIKWKCITFQYTAGFVTTPDDIKQVMLMMTSGIYNKRKAEGISEFQQGEVSVKFNTQKESSTYQDMLANVISKYSKNAIYS